MMSNGNEDIAPNTIDDGPENTTTVRSIDENGENGISTKNRIKEEARRAQAVESSLESERAPPAGIIGSQEINKNNSSSSSPTTTDQQQQQQQQQGNSNREEEEGNVDGQVSEGSSAHNNSSTTVPTTDNHNNNIATSNKKKSSTPPKNNKKKMSTAAPSAKKETRGGGSNKMTPAFIDDPSKITVKFIFANRDGLSVVLDCKPSDTVGEVKGALLSMWPDELPACSGGDKLRLICMGKGILMPDTRTMEDCEVPVFKTHATPINVSVKPESSSEGESTKRKGGAGGSGNGSADGGSGGASSGGGGSGAGGAGGDSSNRASTTCGCVIL